MFKFVQVPIHMIREHNFPNTNRICNLLWATYSIESVYLIMQSISLCTSLTVSSWSNCFIDLIAWPVQWNQSACFIYGSLFENRQFWHLSKWIKWIVWWKRKTKMCIQEKKEIYISDKGNCLVTPFIIMVIIIVINRDLHYHVPGTVLNILQILSDSTFWSHHNPLSSD